MATIINASNSSGLTLTSDLSGNLQFQNNGIALPMIKAYVQFTCPAGTVAINGSYNVASISRASAGVYTITFTNSVGNNPCVLVTGGGVAGVYDAYATLSATPPTSANAVVLGLQTGTNTQKDLADCSLVVIG